MKGFFFGLISSARLKVITVWFLISNSITEVRLPATFAELNSGFRIQEIKFSVNNQQRIVFESIHFILNMPVLHIGKRFQCFENPYCLFCINVNIRLQRIEFS